MTIITRRMSDTPDMLNLRRFSRMLDQAVEGWPFSPGANGSVTSSWGPPCDVFEDKEALKIVAELPGVKPEDVKLSLVNQTLTIRGEKKQEAEERTEQVHRYERSYGLFERSFTLPNIVDADRVQARYDNGILTVTLPKVERAKPREIPVATK